MRFGDTEQLTLWADRETGLRAVVAVDDSTRGPGLGGVRWLDYPSEDAAIAECRRLARVMTLKNACADLPYGGAKAVVLRDRRNGVLTAAARAAVMRAFGRFVARMGGAYLPGVDMGTTVDDLAAVGAGGADVSCDRDDPSPWTAAGVFAGIEAALRRTDGATLARRTVLVQGVGHVGAPLARRLAAAGARLLLADTDTAAAGDLAAETGAETVDPSDVRSTPCDVFAPCATAGVIGRADAGRLRCRIVAGGANDVLARPECAAALARNGVVYVPDFLVNAGGVIHIHATRAGWGEEKLRESVDAVGDRVDRVLADAARRGRTPLAVAEAMAAERLGRPVSLPA